VRDCKRSIESRASLLRILALHSTDLALNFSQEWITRRRSVQEKNKPLTYAALDIWLTVDTESEWAQATKMYKRFGKDSLLNLESLREGHGIEGKQLVKWPASVLRELLIILHKEFPSGNDPQRSGARSIWPVDELMHLRDRIPIILSDRGGCEDVLTSLGNEIPELRCWLRSRSAHEAASKVLANAEEESAIPLRQVLQTFENSDYRVIRSEHDLLRVLVRTLKEINRDAGNHLEMLYFKPKGGKRKRQPEDALQAYVHCRLTDLLPGKILSRETKVSRRKKLDIHVLAPTLTNRTATVVIEVKWSDNQELRTSLVEQLGKRYLLDNNSTHGLYLVGRCSRLFWSGLKDRSNDGIGAKLQEQADAFHGKNDKVFIKPVVLDLRWRSKDS